MMAAARCPPGDAMRRQKRQRGDRIGVIAVVLSAIVALAAEHRAQAQNALRVSRMLPAASAPYPSNLMVPKRELRDLYVESRNIGAGGSRGKRCEMSPEEFAKFYPPLLDWIRTTLTASAPVAETHLYLGRQYRLSVRQNSQNNVRARVRLRGGFIEVHSDYPKNNNVTRELVDAWFLERAQTKFAERLEICIKQFPNSNAHRPISLIVRRMKKRWGSMTASRRLILNCILVQAPVDAIDYIIHHELCHLTHNHHDSAFFKLIERTMPDWKSRRLELERIFA
jgi:predicted metal-dependent hydrolase